MVLEIRLAQKSEYKQCTEIVQHAFRNYPFFQIFVDDIDKRQKFNEAILDIWCAALYNNTVLVGIENGQIKAMAELQSPTDKGYSNLAYLSLAGLRALYYGGWHNLQAFIQLGNKVGAACDSLPSPKWHLCLLAVSEAQKGYGSQMLHRGIEPYIAKRGGGSLVFNTNAEINRKFYSKNGFEEFASESFPANGKILGNWSFCLKIEPQT